MGRGKKAEGRRKMADRRRLRADGRRKMADRRRLRADGRGKKLSTRRIFTGTCIRKFWYTYP